MVGEAGFEQSTIEVVCEVLVFQFGCGKILVGAFPCLLKFPGPINTSSGVLCFSWFVGLCSSASDLLLR